MAGTEQGLAPPRPSHVLETCLYVRDMTNSAKFYREVLNTEPFYQSVSYFPSVWREILWCRTSPVIPICPSFFFRAAGICVANSVQKNRIAGFALGQTTLLLFQLGLTTDEIDAGPRGRASGHGPSEALLPSLLSGEQKLRQHFCFAVSDPADVAQWDTHFRNLGVPIIGRIDWERGGKSVYFEDPDGHVGEIGSRGIWAHFDLD